ncbi:MAG: hypothetical protein WBA57_18895 [Elainellaceae cyanobacterium]
MSQDGRTLDNHPLPIDSNPTQPHGESGDHAMAEGSPTNSVMAHSTTETTASDAANPQGSAVAIAPPKPQPQPQPQSQSEAQDSSVAVDNPTLYAETSADDLMQEVFGDVDRMLQKGVSIPPESSQPGYVELKPLHLSDLNLEAGGVLAPRSEENAAPLEAPHEATDLAAPTGDRLSSTEGETQSNIATLLLRFALVVSASVALGVGLAVWMAQKSQPQFATQTTTSTEAPSAQTDFINYMTESLDAIDTRYEQADRFASTAIDDDDDEDSSTRAGSGTPLPERVYIPVYQPPQVTAALPSLPAPPFSSTTVPLAVSPAPAPEAPAQASASVPNISPDSNYALVGLLELGDRSAAIFEYGDTAHRIEIGAQIGSSGWSLVSVSAQEAIIRRNGDVRSVYIGQSF